MLSTAKSALALASIPKVKIFIDNIMLARQNDANATASDGSTDLANIICYAVAVMLNNPAFIASFNAIVDPQSVTPIGTPCGTIIKTITLE
jgi:hypothetical protein